MYPSFLVLHEVCFREKDVFGKIKQRITLHMYFTVLTIELEVWNICHSASPTLSPWKQ